MAKIKRSTKKAISIAVACVTLLAVGGTYLYEPAVALAESSGLVKYATDYDSMDDAIEAAEQMTEDTAAEGDTLLKNRNNALPMKGNEYVSVLGVSADELIGAASTGSQSTGSGGGDTVAEVLSDAGFRVNPTLQSYYSSQSATIGQEDTTFNSKVKSSFKLYNDAAIVVISRTGGEGSDCSRNTGEKAGTSLTGENDADSHVALASDGSNSYKHYLMLTDSERELIEMAGKNFDKVIVVLNTSNAMEIEELRDNSNVDAIINIDRPGQGGLAALAKILNGEVNPSGGLVDEWYTDFTADPTWYNFGDNSQTSSTGAGSNTYMSSNGSSTGVTTSGSDVIGDTEGFHGVDYEESIYLGYKYYETYYYDMYNAGYTEEAQQWWEDNVTYAFGYGLSYTTFSFKSGGIYTDESCKSALTSGDCSSLFKSTTSNAADVETLYIPVTVTNTGDVAGKKTVQVYVSAPYDDTSVVEKASVSLVGYAKTDELKPGQSQTVVVSVNVQDMASWYSYYKQSDGTSGAYIMEKGEYTLRVMEDSHYDCRTEYDDLTDSYYIEEDGAKTTECYDEETFTLSTDIGLEVDDYSGNQVSSLFTDGLNDNGDGMDGNSEVTDSNFGNVRTADMMADGSSGMTSMTRNTKVSSANNSVAAMNDNNVSSTSVVNYTGVGVPTNNVTSESGESRVAINGFDYSFPVAPTTKDLTFKDNVLDNWSYWDNYAVSSTYSGVSDASSNYSQYYQNDDDAGYVWSQTSVSSTWTQAKGVLGLYTNAGANGQSSSQQIYFYSTQTDTSNIKLTFADMAGVAYDDASWDTFLNQLTYDELCQVNTYCGYGTANIDSVGKSVTYDADGPNNIDSQFQCCSESLLAATWNVEIAERRGIIIGNICLLDGLQGWYGSGADTHRSPFSGRNNEYYSQDGILGGYMGAAVTQGVQSKGIICYTKHVLMNDQETDRGCLFTWCDEQAMRENYMKTFQIIFQEGESQAGMTAYGRIAGKSNTNNTNLSVELYQEEWGSHAYFVTDGYIGWNQRTNPDMMVRAGAQTILTTMNTEYLSGQTDPTTGEQTTGGFYLKGETLPDGQTAAADGVYLIQAKEDGTTYYEISYTQWYCVREMAHNVLYQVANSAGQYNGYNTIAVTGRSLTATENLAADGLSVSIASLVDDDSTVTYAISGNLPSGLTLDSLTGEISGTPTEAGTFNFTVNYTIDGWVNKSADYTLTVDTAIQASSESDSFTEATVGTEFYAELTSTVYTSAEYNSITYSVTDGALPDGLTLSDEGIITGTPTTAGTYTFTVTLTADNVDETTTAASLASAQLVSGWDKGGSGSTEKTIETTFTIVVTGDEATEPSQSVTLEDLAASIEDITSNIDDLQADIDSLQTTVNGLTADTDSSSSTSESSGCSSNVVPTVATVAAMFGIFAAAVVVVRSRKHNNNKDE